MWYMVCTLCIVWWLLCVECRVHEGVFFHHQLSQYIDEAKQCFQWILLPQSFAAA